MNCSHGSNIWYFEFTQAVKTLRFLTEEVLPPPTLRSYVSQRSHLPVRLQALWPFAILYAIKRLFFFFVDCECITFVALSVDWNLIGRPIRSLLCLRMPLASGWVECLTFASCEIWEVFSAMLLTQKKCLMAALNVVIVEGSLELLCWCKLKTFISIFCKIITFFNMKEIFSCAKKSKPNNPYFDLIRLSNVGDLKHL